jgi:hypothetical protein
VDRPIIYTEEQARGYDVSKGWQDTFKGIGWLASDLLNYALTTGGQTVVAGCAGTQTSPTSLSINISAGEIYYYGILDPNPEGDLPADGSSRYMQGHTSATTVALSTSALSSGQSQWALVQATFAFVDVVRSGDPSGGVLPFYNAANPTSPLQGQGGSGAVLNTEHQATITFSVVYGTPATTGSQVPPSAATGNVGLYLILLTYGQTTILTGNILVAGPSVGTGVPSNYPVAPFLAGLLSSHHSGNPGQAPKVNLATEVQGTLPSTNYAVTGSFTATLTGPFSTNPTGTIGYTIIGNVVTVYATANIEGTATTSTAITITGCPSAILPVHQQIGSCGFSLISNNVGVCGSFLVQAPGSGSDIILGVVTVSGSALVQSNFATGLCGIQGGWSITYPLT